MKTKMNDWLVDLYPDLPGWCVKLISDEFLELEKKINLLEAENKTLKEILSPTQRWIYEKD